MLSESAIRNPHCGPAPVVQRSFDLAIPDARLLVSIDVASSCLNRDHQDIIDLIELGSLEYAWNIAVPGSRVIERRIHRDSLRCYQLHLRDARTEADYYASLFQHSRPTLRLSELYRVLNCSSQHALQLRRDGCFGPATAAVTSGISPAVRRDAVIAFLKKRRCGYQSPTDH